MLGRFALSSLSFPLGPELSDCATANLWVGAFPTVNSLRKCLSSQAHPRLTFSVCPNLMGLSTEIYHDRAGNG